jgi:16S rRNA processing protein RimM
MSAPSSSDELVELAAVVRAHGLAGELALKLFNPESELVPELREVVLRLPSGETRRYAVRAVRGAGDGILVRLEGVDDRNASEPLKGSVVCVPRAALPTLEEGEYYLVDLVGLTARDPAGEVIGRVHDVIAYPSVECLVMQCGDVWREVPDLPRYVLEVHVREGYVVVDHLDELEPVKAPEKR